MPGIPQENKVPAPVGHQVLGIHQENIPLPQMHVVPMVPLAHAVQGQQQQFVTLMQHGALADDQAQEYDLSNMESMLGILCLLLFCSQKKFCGSRSGTGSEPFSIGSWIRI